LTMTAWKEKPNQLAAISVCVTKIRGNARISLVHPRSHLPKSSLLKRVVKQRKMSRVRIVTFAHAEEAYGFAQKMTAKSLEIDTSTLCLIKGMGQMKVINKNKLLSTHYNIYPTFVRKKERNETNNYF